MSKPVQLKIFFGMMLITKRVYLLLTFAGLAVLIGMWIAFETVLNPSTKYGLLIDQGAPWFYDALPWLVGIGVILEGVEMAVVLRRFRKREEFLKRERGEIAGNLYHE